jgi:tRNA modification GTPase
MQQLRGELSRRIGAIRQELIGILGLLEANIDFPEEDVLSAEMLSLKEKLEKAEQEIKNLLECSRRGRILREGIHVVICGKPNVGKSSLLNALLKKERSIVTAVAGTTRDTIEEIIDIKGIPVRIVDTAGIIEPRDLIEKEAVRRAKQHIKLADLVILLFDGTKIISQEDELLIRKTKDKNTLAVINKIDLRQRINKERLLKKFKHLVSVSAKKRKNIHLLEEAIANLFYSGKISAAESATLSNLRHIQVVREAEKLIAEASNSLDNSLSWEFVAQDIKDALGILDGILGNNSGEELLDKIFSEFCIGK